MARFTNNLDYTRLDDVWVILNQPLHFEFTLNDVLKANPPMLKSMVEKTGLEPDRPLYISAPKGYVTDLASIPKRLHWLYSPDGDHAPAAVIHDLLYQTLAHYYPVPEDKQLWTGIGKLNKYHDKFMADRIFLIAMRALDVSAFKRTAFFNAVTMFGKTHYRDEDVYMSYDDACNLKDDIVDSEISCRILSKGMSSTWNGYSMRKLPCQNIIMGEPFDVFKGLPSERIGFITNKGMHSLVWYKNMARPFLYLNQTKNI